MQLGRAKNMIFFEVGVAIIDFCINDASTNNEDQRLLLYSRTNYEYIGNIGF